MWRVSPVLMKRALKNSHMEGFQKLGPTLHIHHLSSCKGNHRLIASPSYSFRSLVFRFAYLSLSFLPKLALLIGRRPFSRAHI